MDVGTGVAHGSSRRTRHVRLLGCRAGEGSGRSVYSEEVPEHGSVVCNVSGSGASPVFFLFFLSFSSFVFSMIKVLVGTKSSNIRPFVCRFISTNRSYFKSFLTFTVL